MSGMLDGPSRLDSGNDAQWWGARHRHRHGAWRWPWDAGCPLLHRLGPDSKALPRAVCAGTGQRFAIGNPPHI